MDNHKGVIAIGASGLVGSRIIELLNNSFDFVLGSIENGIDITNASTLPFLMDNNARWVLHLAAKADVDGCEKDKELGENGAAWKINVIGTKNVVEACLTHKKSLIYVSTDFVFDGTKPLSDKYSEEDRPNPTNWYAQTKYEGEKLVESSGLPYIIMRIAYPYRKKFDQKSDFVRSIRTRLSEGKSISAITDHVMTPTCIDDIAYAIKALIEGESQGIYHVVGSQSLTPYEACQLIAKIYGFPSSLISETTRETFFQSKANRPYNLALKNDKIRALGVSMKTFEEGLQEISKA